MRVLLTAVATVLVVVLFSVLSERTAHAFEVDSKVLDADPGEPRRQLLVCISVGPNEQPPIKDFHIPHDGNLDDQPVPPPPGPVTLDPPPAGEQCGQEACVDLTTDRPGWKLDIQDGHINVFANGANPTADGGDSLKQDQTTCFVVTLPATKKWSANTNVQAVTTTDGDHSHTDGTGGGAPTQKVPKPVDISVGGTVEVLAGADGPDVLDAEARASTSWGLYAALAGSAAAAAIAAVLGAGWLARRRSR